MINSILTVLQRAAREYGDRIVYMDGAAGKGNPDAAEAAETEAGGAEAAEAPVKVDPAASQLSFAGLERLSAAMGTAVARRSKPEKPIAVMTGRHVFTPACYLGVARAGCVYAPMDPAMPAMRLKQILSVIEPELMIVDRQTRERVSELEYEGELLIMEEGFETEPEALLLQEREEGLTEDSPLYVLFTSGSSGTPKGVLTSHGAMMCYLDGLNQVIRLGEEDVLGNQAPLDYIAAIRDMYLPVMTGARTVIIPPQIFAMPEKLFGLLNEYGVTTLCWSATGVEIPAKLGAFDGDVLPEKLKRIVFSGSVISNRYLRLWQDALPEVRFINQYGPTEATGSCTWYPVEEKVEEDTVLPIGKPYAHYGILVLTEEGEEAEPGETGEICVRGPALALGYYGNEAQTAAAFVRNPLQKSYPEIIYRTGDLGTLREDGQLMFIGRKDRQVKHMGHRVELDEIEQAALRIDGVEECCSGYITEGKKITLCYAGTIEKKEVARAIREFLPEFMIPRKIKRMEELPHLPNGKIDRKRIREIMG